MNRRNVTVEILQVPKMLYHYYTRETCSGRIKLTKTRHRTRRGVVLVGHGTEQSAVSSWLDTAQNKARCRLGWTRHKQGAVSSWMDTAQNKTRCRLGWTRHRTKRGVVLVGHVTEQDAVSSWMDTAQNKTRCRLGWTRHRTRRGVVLVGHGTEQSAVSSWLDTAQNKARCRLGWTRHRTRRGVVLVGTLDSRPRDPGNRSAYFRLETLAISFVTISFVPVHSVV